MYWWNYDCNSVVNISWTRCSSWFTRWLFKTNHVRQFCSCDEEGDLDDSPHVLNVVSAPALKLHSRVDFICVCWSDIVLGLWEVDGLNAEALLEEIGYARSFAFSKYIENIYLLSGLTERTLYDLYAPWHGILDQVPPTHTGELGRFFENATLYLPDLSTFENSEKISVSYYKRSQHFVKVRVFKIVSLKSLRKTMHLTQDCKICITLNKIQYEFITNALTKSAKFTSKRRRSLQNV